MTIGILAAALGGLISAAAIIIPRIVNRGNNPQDHTDSLAYLKQTSRSGQDIARGNATIRPRLLIRRTTGRCRSATALIPSRAARPVTIGQRRDRRHSMDSAAASGRHRNAGPPNRQDNEAFEVGLRVERM
jgi:hypothetical protein